MTQRRRKTWREGRGVENRKKKWTDKKKHSFYDLLSISSSVNALALSSGVGSNKTQPFLRAP